MAGDDELSRIREARRQEIAQQLEQQAEAQVEAETQQAEAEQESAHLAELMRTLLTPEARQRLARVELAYPELALSVKQHLAVLAQDGRIAPPVGDDMLKRILSGLSDNKRETSIRRL